MASPTILSVKMLSKLYSMLLCDDEPASGLSTFVLRTVLAIQMLLLVATLSLISRSFVAFEVFILGT